MSATHFLSGKLGRRTSSIFIFLITLLMAATIVCPMAWSGEFLKVGLLEQQQKPDQRPY